jgi:tetratricopeptide (TPR) repeat protein
VYNAKQDEYDERFDTSYNRLLAERGWPLMKLGRFDEAKYWGTQGILQERDWQKSLGYNVLCATAGEQGLRTEAFEACSSALRHAQDTGSGIAVDASNAANAAMAILDFDAVEEYSRLAIQHGDGTTVSAWINLIHLYLGDARPDAAIDAVEGVLQSLAAEEPAMRLQKRADVDGAFALLLLLSGEEQTAYDKIHRAIQFPDRRGVISTSEAQSSGSHRLLRFLAKRLVDARQDEHISSKGWWARIQHWWSQLFGDPSLEVDAQAVRTVLQQDTHLVSTIRPYLDKGLTAVPYWMLGELVTILGTSVVESAIAEARAIDNFEGTEGYYQFLETEIAYQRGDWSDVIELGTSSRSKLPMVEQLMRARLLALEGVARGRTGDRLGQIQHFEQVMEIDPSVFRRLDVELPVRIASGSGLDGDVLTALSRSPRFESSQDGFSLQVTANQVCLLGSMGQEFTCTRYPNREESMSDADYVTLITDAFHSQAFSLSTGMSTADWRSLDGRATTSKDRTRAKLKQILQQESQE